MRKLAWVACLVVLHLPTAGAQTNAPMEVELSAPVRTGPDSGVDLLPVETAVEFDVLATIIVPPGALCVDDLALEFTASQVPGLTVRLDPSSLVLDLPVEQATPKVLLEGARWTVGTRFVATFSYQAEAFEPHRFSLGVRVRPAGTLPCQLQEASDARYVELAPDFRPGFALETPPGGDEAVTVRVLNHANGDARFTADARRSGSSWAPLNISFRLERQHASSGLNTQDVRVPTQDLPFGFDGQLRFTQVPAYDAAGPRVAYVGEIHVDTAVTDEAIRMYAREEAPGVEFFPALSAIGLVMWARRPTKRA